ncbi:excinuclease ABC subunit UvrA [Synoicihabitans lomoniglobus]|uniref:UvrABC system protein A n=1 Tax=Synoicihabitans lomoniglobus TaxID=2909285 RepID=A0AAF0CQW6_9BACT|nr:excinuclease ABC subunit UvrA [Opitutaceae bacterium LMO-M01]WED66430.1 excinuclease ABC subunit UvrA [Opitutaceae bacterium LMO-M01]
MQAETHIHVKGAREHNLQNLEVRLPRGKLVVVTGPSGSGKSSLAFDTIYAEGYRKYMESLSTSARQVLEQLPRPDVDFVHGLSPVLAIEQRTAGESPRSTIATVTEVADYARLLWALHGEAHCPKDGGKVERRSLDDNVARVLAEAAGQRIMILAPALVAKASVLREELPRLRQRGFQRVRIGGEIKQLDEADIVPSGQGVVPIEVDLVVDRLVAVVDQRSRLSDSLELAFREGADRAMVLAQAKRDAPWREIKLSQSLACEICGDVFEKLTPRHFSFNHNQGACTTCGGLGRKLRFVPDLVVPDKTKTVRGGALKPWRLGGKNLIIQHNAMLKQLAEQLPFDANTPWQDLPEDVRETLLHGGGDRLFAFKLKRMREPKAMPWTGVIPALDETWRNTESDGFRARLSTYMIGGPCPECGGSRLNARSSAVVISTGERRLNVPEFFALDVQEAHEVAVALQERFKREESLRDVVTGIEQRLRFLGEVGLGYLTLNRDYGTLSGGESQRVRLATQLGMGLMGVIYVLDEPSIGLHPADNDQLLRLLIALRDRGNTVLVVEHDEDTMRIADEVIELGPGAGTEGGRVLFQGAPAQLMQADAKQSVSGPYLSRKLRVEKSAPTKLSDGAFLTVREARENNLRGVDARFPVGLLTCVTGVSGSGKSTLVNDILATAAARKLNRAKAMPGLHRHIEHLEFFEKLVQVDQSPIGRSPRSNPATYTKLLDHLRDLFAQVPLAKVRGYKASRFSFNIRGGRCERCQGDGAIKLDMQFLANAYAPCPSCGGKRFNRETLEVLFHGHSIADVLAMTVRDAMSLFRNIPKVMDKLETLAAVGLGYLQLGQSATTLSGGEAQRLKLSLELSKRSQGDTLYILDEPTTGLHWVDIQHLMDLLFKLRDAGHTVIVIEHNLDVINLADWIIDLGPGGGRHGGEIVYAGPREGIEKTSASATGQALKRWADPLPAVK